MKSSKVLAKLLTLQNQMKLYHWQTKYYSRHKAADKIFNTMIKMTDKFIETYQGKYGIVYLNSNNKKLELDNIDDEDIIDFLKKMRSFLVNDLPKILEEKENTNMLNIRDEMLETINTTLYLFTLE